MDLERWARRCTKCGNDNHHREALPPVEIPLAKRFECFVHGVRLPRHAPAESVNLCIDSDSRSDTYRRWFRCLTCDARYISEMQQDVNVGEIEGGIRDHGYLVEVAEYDRSLALARSCPRPGDAACTCPAHTTRPVTVQSAWYVT